MKIAIKGRTGRLKTGGANFREIPLFLPLGQTFILILCAKKLLACPGRRVNVLVKISGITEAI